ncbi:hypothetical protein MAA8898_00972 [Maliponia aquimaris]|uniref:D-galactarate dehydratase n=2 Tax=Maliponia aquimaris TaxID=1673631 RepID=A0A238K1A2_9RHOB|nr:hypothetical protein MAA8898_00972 [Maliponia aquimaris]
MRSLTTMVVILAGLTLASCGKLPFGKEAARADATPPPGTTRPQARPEAVDARQPPPNARTAEQFDTTTAEERRKAAAAPAAAAEKLLGETVASLGDPVRPGFWLETPLVSAPQKGRVLNPATGKSAQVDLIPIDGPPTAGSRLSLAAMRLVEAPLTALPTLRVFAGG